jgi:hypothetical protein
MARESEMKRQSGFALFQVLLIAALVGGFVYSMMITEDAEQGKSKADQLAVVLTPATHAFLKYGLLNGVGTYQGADFYGVNYIISSSYEDSLASGGYDYSGSNTKLTLTAGPSQTISSANLISCAAVSVAESSCPVYTTKASCLAHYQPTGGQSESCYLGGGRNCSLSNATCAWMNNFCYGFGPACS